MYKAVHEVVCLTSRNRLIGRGHVQLREGGGGGEGGGGLPNRALILDAVPTGPDGGGLWKRNTCVRRNLREGRGGVGSKRTI